MTGTSPTSWHCLMQLLLDSRRASSNLRP